MYLYESPQQKQTKLYPEFPHRDQYSAHMEGILFIYTNATIFGSINGSKFW